MGMKTPTPNERQGRQEYGYALEIREIPKYLGMDIYLVQSRIKKTQTTRHIKRHTVLIVRQYIPSVSKYTLMDSINNFGTKSIDSRYYYGVQFTTTSPAYRTSSGRLATFLLSISP